MHRRGSSDSAFPRVHAHKGEERRTAGSDVGNKRKRASSREKHFRKTRRMGKRGGATNNEKKETLVLSRPTAE